MFLRHLPEFLIIRHVVLSLEVASKFLLFFQGFKECLEVSFAEASAAFPHSCANSLKYTTAQMNSAR
jgi:hypothetical protein